MAKRKDKSRLALLGDIHVIGLQTILGSIEDLVLLTEHESQDLWLTASVSNKNEVTYTVANGPAGHASREHHTTDLEAAMGLYCEIRAAGSWSEYDSDVRAKAAMLRANKKV